MVAFLQRVFKVYPEEVRLLLWVTLIQLAMRVSSVLINNYAQTAFLKRFGVEYLPTIFLVEAVLTFIVINAVGVLMEKYRSIRVFTWLLLFFAAAVAVIWGLLPLHLAILYPILFILKSQAIETLPILYWDILNDLFTTRQSKRLFTLITAGGILGTTIGSVMTGTVARWVGVDNVLLIFVGGTVLAALLNGRTERIVGSPLEPRTDLRKRRKPDKVADTIKQVRTFSKRSPFLKYMILLVAIPNMVLPILTYQFNVVLDVTYATEQDTLQFLGLFRGITNAIIFGILLFSGHLVSRWGVATSLMFHPINYLLAFASLLFRFDIFSAIYARFSTETLKTALNNPARAVLYNFFPPNMRSLVRVFLRGTVVRLSDLTGSALLMVLRAFMDPRLLSLVAAPLVGIWIAASFLIKRRYPSLLIQVLMDKQIDWRRLEDVDLRALAQDRRTVETLQRGLHDANPEIALLCAELLAQAAPAGWAAGLLEALPSKPQESQRAMLDLLGPAQAAEALPSLMRATEGAQPATLALLLTAMARMDPAGSLSVLQSFVDHPDDRVRAVALMGAYCSGDPQVQETWRRRVKELLGAGGGGVRTALEILSETGDPAFSQALLEWARSPDPELRALSICGLARMGAPESTRMALAAADDPAPQVRRSAVQALMQVGGDGIPLDVLVRLLADEDPEVRELASRAIKKQGEDAARHLIPSLASPSRAVRNAVLAILDDLDARPVELSQFITRELEKAYWHLACVQSLQGAEQDTVLSLLRDHLLERNQAIQETVLRVLAVQEGGGNMPVILRALQTRDKRDVDNAIEALESTLHSGIRRILIPLLEQTPLETKLSVGQRRFAIPVQALEKPAGAFPRLLEDEDAVTRTLCLYAIADGCGDALPPEAVEKRARDADPLVRKAAQLALARLTRGASLPVPEDGRVRLMEKVRRLRKIPMFANLTVRELMAIAAIAHETACARGHAVVREGEQGDALYLVLDGELRVIKAMGGPQQTTLAGIGANDFFGEMALFDREPRSATVTAESDALLLKIEDRAFAQLMRHYPTIPINICVVLSQRMRTLHERLKGTQAKGERPVA